MNKDRMSQIAFIAFVIMLLILLFCSTAFGIVSDNINPESWKYNVDYMQEMINILESDSISQIEYELAEAYEMLRNGKIASLYSDEYVQTDYFKSYGYDADAILFAIRNPITYPENTVSDEDVDLLARITFLECGSNWIPDWVLEYFCSVVVNRVNHYYYPDTLDGVLSQNRQFTSYANRWRTSPTDRCYTIARDVLENGSKIPESVVYFSQVTQGSGIYETWSNHYFCYF